MTTAATRELTLGVDVLPRGRGAAQGRMRRIGVLLAVAAVALLLSLPTDAWAAKKKPTIGTPPKPMVTTSGAAAPISYGGRPRVPLSKQASLPRWLKILNRYRIRAGAPELALDPALSASAQQHANYMLTNRVVTHSENPALPGYSATGAQAGAVSLVGSGFSSPEAYLTAWLSSPFHLIPLLDPTLTATGWGYAAGNNTTTAVLNVYSARTGALPTTGWPRINLLGPIDWLQMADPSYPDPTNGCPGPTGKWYGAPIVVNSGPTAAVTSATATLTENGVNVPVCVRVASNFGDATAAALMKGKVLVIPLRPLAAQSTFTGQITSNLGSTGLTFTTNPVR